MPFADKNKKLEYNRQFMKKLRAKNKILGIKNKPVSRVNELNKDKNRRLTILELLGFKCCKCGFDDIRALQIDHKNGGGNTERKRFNRGYYKYVLQCIINNEDKYQILCANCNWIKRCENNEHR